MCRSRLIVWAARRTAIAAAVLATGGAFDRLAAHISNTPDGMLLYHGAAAFVDALLFKSTRLVAVGYLRRDVEIIFISSAVANALGWALYMAWTPPYFYDHMVMGLNYALAIRLLMGDGNVFSRVNLFNRVGTIRRYFSGYRDNVAKEARR